MKTHGGMRPQDVVILLYIAIHKERLYQKNIADALQISRSEVSDSIKRSELSRLINAKTHEVSKRTLIDFLQYGLPYVFPAIPGSMVRGIITGAHSEVLKNIPNPEIPYVWRTSIAETVGIAIEPLYHTLPKAIVENKAFYTLLCLVDAVRIGHTREKMQAMDELKKIFINELQDS